MQTNIVDGMIDEAVRFLNDLVNTDREAIEKLIESRVSCNDAMLNHPTVQAGSDSNGKPAVGMLGIINGLLGVQPEGSKKPGWGYVAAVFNDSTGKLTNFIRIDK